ncbi:hypothetical protein MAPG_10749 [Magnaporthiopsis poae ATCC 64411]|uniref:Uncharacterized protein n=1 Tax=Magnaporthiopsis poae (strain ATCC 64411 / 73-15) TaxID=644358 RepID=A0A0C4EDF1_MAGP6|nr:hypothetical protein MAPG_10749 [Magnaporthiopsis poae ATCC 64411]
MSSPMVHGGVAMQTPNSNMGSAMGSPPRPASVVQTHAPMAAAMTASMSARGSQQSHAGTPRTPNATPNTALATPSNRPPHMAQTPRTSQMAPPPRSHPANGANLYSRPNFAQPGVAPPARPTL